MYGLRARVLNQQCSAKVKRGRDGGEDALEVHADAQGNTADTGDLAVEEAIFTFQRPGLVGVIQERLAVVADGLAVAVDDEGRVVILGRGGPLGCNIDLLGIPDDDDTVVLERRGTGPERGDARARGLKIGRDVLQRPEVITWSRTRTC